MQRRSVANVLILSIVTLGIYTIVWHVETRREMVSEGADIPSTWFWAIPLVNVYWYWKWAGGVEQCTDRKMSQVVAFLLMLLLGVIGMAIVQDAFNKTLDQRATRGLPQARIA